MTAGHGNIPFLYTGQMTAFSTASTTTKMGSSHRNLVASPNRGRGLYAFIFLLFSAALLRLLVPWRSVAAWTSQQGKWDMCRCTGFGCEDISGSDNNTANAIADTYLIGVGKADITGPVVEVNLMGYADPKQVGTGLRHRLYSRAFIVGDFKIPADRFVYLVLDTQSGDTAVRYGILEKLRNLGPEYAGYGHHNIAVTGTHSHSGPPKALLSL